jgi:hypothetical protein
MRPWSKLCRAALVGLAALLGIFMTATSVTAQTSRGMKLFLSVPAAAALMSSRTNFSFDRTKFSFDFTGENDAISLLSTGTGTERSAGVDYSAFAMELVAFLIKEVLHDSNEFDRPLRGPYLSSSMPEQLSSYMPTQRSEFGSHCLTIITQLGSQLPLPRSAPSLTVDSTSTLDYGVRALTAGLVLRQVWSAFQNHVEDNRSGVSLDPKVGTRRVGIKLTFRW